MGTVAEGFIFRLPAPAQGVLFLQGVCLNLMPGTAVSLCIVADLLFTEMNTSRNDVGAVFAHPDSFCIHL
jgi:hypothetical protein